MKPIITLTNSAIKQINHIIKINNCKALSLYVKGGGCNGFNYQFKPTNDPPKKYDEIVKTDDITIQVCSSSIMHLLGTEIDYTNDIMGNSFKFNNPNAVSKCGCGTSFSI